MFYSNLHLNLTQKLLHIKCKGVQMPRENVIVFGVFLFYFELVWFGLSSSSGVESDFCFT